MRIDILTLLPATFTGVFDESILGAARRNGLIDIRIHPFRPYGEGRHRTVDDTPFGGGPGMVLKPGPLAAALADLRKDGPPAPVIGLTPQGHVFDQTMARELARLPRVILVCGRYEGFDERILPEFDLQISIGDYVLTGGEFPAMVVVDALSRMIPGTVGDPDSVREDSFFDGTLDHPQYTRPAIWQERAIPAVLRDGHHSRIADWRRGEALWRTVAHRPDLFRQLALSSRDRALLQDALANHSQSIPDKGA
ncbi:MAG: tRNA (Guanine37-N1) -methyltransferase [Candidatus Ozemobacter sibiricus]|jgi:tRNA (guanine37-N1)-methyltransferase|uniref:tRNA (guanine-N(1)-)-methyltransferase n=1 Tax=Candidatus Ozemobacter sibiricus TaxID=2268124 RepID=A0A367ZNQ7_9BACT|nr:MAG: tRNA (Guanine37-N1) -methyltransferase [Candidatus Ozemobacter sibiricus]